ncbi:DoxX family protein [Fulvivirgaceae bacterium BMA10]|uniref:DoxX family protein n=1 Tax=Splendidivirga corallicola TaxID=3051826 RepID=A0ABT8KJI0_9BACT|nr:DoxX family protein [Fulvivirgaceae bacterium BMA10]
MDALAKLETWAAPKRTKWMGILRIALGTFIVYKGIIFTIDINSLQAITSRMDILFASVGLAHYVIAAHIIGGSMLAFGIFTRGASLIQIPILIGAVIFVNFDKGFLSVGNHMELEVSIIVLALLIFFFIFGGGKWSLDELRRKDIIMHKT